MPAPQIQIVPENQGLKAAGAALYTTFGDPVNYKNPPHILREQHSGWTIRVQNRKQALYMRRILKRTQGGDVEKHILD